MNVTGNERSIYFPLASNASSLVAGAGVGQVRRRLKNASLLYEKVLIEAGQLHIQAGPEGGSVFRTSGPEDLGGNPQKWQTTTTRSKTQSSRFSISIATESAPGVPSTQPFREVMNSASTIAWEPTFRPFARELPSQCSWVTFGSPEKTPPEIERVSRAWKLKDQGSAALEQLLPVRFVRDQVLSALASDLASGIAGGWDVSADRLHSRVFHARFADPSLFKVGGFALPILAPKAGSMDWDDVAKLRKLKGIRQLRDTLAEIEENAIREMGPNGDLERAVHSVYERRIMPTADALQSALPQSALAVGEIMIGIGASYATMGFGLWSGLIGAAPGTAIAGVGLARRIRANDRMKWLGVMQQLQS